MVSRVNHPDDPAKTRNRATEIARAEALIKKERDNFLLIFAAVPIGLILVDTHTIITETNKTLATMVLRDPGELIGKRVGGGLGCIHSFENPKGCGFATACPECPLRNGIETALSAGTSFHNTEVNITLLINGIPRQRRLSVNAEPVELNGNQQIIVAIDDVTDKMRLDEMMVQSEKMLSVGGLAAGMAHEINNPLAGMMHTADVMKSRLENLQMPANLRAADEIGVPMESIKAFMEKRSILRMVKTINESGRRVAKIVNNMLSFARKADAKVSSHNPARLLDQILELAATDYDLKKQYDFKTIKIKKEYEDNLPLIPCEGAKIQQVVLNILRNGAQAMQTQNTDKNPDPCFILGLCVEKKTNMLKIEIEDNGPGMDEKTLKRIFKPFFTTKPPGIGTGLGLSVSYFIITENHGGSMDVKSIQGKGSTFIIRLPLDQSGEKHGSNL